MLKLMIYDKIEDKTVSPAIFFEFLESETQFWFSDKMSFLKMYSFLLSCVSGTQSVKVYRLSEDGVFRKVNLALLVDYECQQPKRFKKSLIDIKDIYDVLFNLFNVSNNDEFKRRLNEIKEANYNSALLKKYFGLEIRDLDSKLFDVYSFNSFRVNLDYFNV